MFPFSFFFFFLSYQPPSVLGITCLGLSSLLFLSHALIQSGEGCLPQANNMGQKMQIQWDKCVGKGFARGVSLLTRVNWLEELPVRTEQSVFLRVALRAMMNHGVQTGLALSLSFLFSSLPFLLLLFPQLTQEPQQAIALAFLVGTVP